jgi:hypothetical protein
MTELLIDNMNNPGLWHAFQPDGITPSAQINLSADATRFRFGTDQVSGRVSATTSALGHQVQRSLANLNLGNFDELRFWAWSDRTADGSASKPFFLEARLGSAALPVGSAGNTWSRVLPVSQGSTWELIRLSLSDLPGGVRSAANLLQIRCIEAAASFNFNLDDLLAVREQMITDIDTALLTRLNNTFSVNGNQVQAVIYHPELQPTSQQPFIQIKQYDIQYCGERTPLVQSRADYSGSGFMLRPSNIAYDVFYELDFFAQIRSEKTQIMEFVLQELSPLSHLLVNDVPLTVDWVVMDPFDHNGQLRSDRCLLYFKVATRQEVGPVLVVRPPSTVIVEVDQV